MKQLHVIGRDTSAERLRSGGVSGELLSWWDCLYEGPVLAGLSLDEMSRMRARFVAGSVEGRPFEEMLERFSKRDGILKSFKSCEEVTLWLGPGLGDQLQLLQILHWFSRRELGKTRLSLVPLDMHSEIGRAEPGEVTPGELELAKRAWESVCSERPVALSELVGEDLSALPFLRAALIRLLEQYPWTQDGLSRTERQIMEAVAKGPEELLTVYRSSQIDGEEPPFMTEPPFLFHVKSLCGGGRHLIRFEGGLTEEDGPPYDERIWKRRLQLTDIGRKILMGQADCVRLYGIDRWIGGVHLRGARAAWRWDGRRRLLVALRP
jgi:hypothetical protein